MVMRNFRQVFLTLAIGIDLATVALINILASAQGNLFGKAKGAIMNFGGAKSGAASSVVGLSNDEIGRGLKEAFASARSGWSGSWTPLMVSTPSARFTSHCSAP
jgi:hypothetical protein